ncbi:hypothetical protein QJS10_CPB17g01727 [Acorus calamus]|uniref:DUF4005 domain-containing protein n=1 Tax=Acorus calamus TaxID=4465 RepID=A0AAV9CV84_ACOCL|nr:hypothetical protein QJS10_CPB17g01727 [Acorus calamus]
MAKKKTWLDFVKKIFSSKSKSKSEKKEKRRRCVLGGLKSRRPPALTALPQFALVEAEEEQSKHALAVASATAAAAEAAVFAAWAAAEVVRLTATPQSLHRSRIMAAVKVQTAFRGYLARRALRALKALVRLQAIVRGRAVRRQTAATLKSLQSLMKIQSQVRANRVRMARDNQGKVRMPTEIRRSPDTYASLRQSNQRRWDDSTLSKERADALFQNRREAALKRERAMEYASSYRERRTPPRPNTPVEQELETKNQRPIWLEKLVDDEQPRKRNSIDVFPVPSPEPITRERKHHRLSDPLPCLDSLRRALDEENRFKRLEFRCNSIRDDDSYSSSPALPSYMVATESTKAKYRSTSTPRQRMRSIDGFSDWCLPCKFVNSDFPSMNSDVSLFNMGGRTPGPYLRSPYLKG